MSMTRSLLTATAVLVGTSTAMLTGGIARAEPAPAPAPALPGASAIEQLANVPAIAPRVLQDMASALTGTPAPAAVAPPPTASITLPQANLPTQIGPQPATVVHPATVPATSPALTPGQLVPNASMNLPTVPGLPVPLPQQVSLPGDLTSLLPGVPTLPGAAPVTTPAVTPSAVPGAFPTVTPSGVPGVVPGAFPAVTPGAVPATAPNPSAVAPVTGLLPDLITLVPVSGLP